MASGLVYEDINSLLSQFKYIIDKSKEMFGEIPSIEDVSEATYGLKVITTKIPQTYHYEDGIMFKTTSRMAPGDGCDSKFYKNLCASDVNYACVSSMCPGGYANCRPVYNGAELNSALNDHGLYNDCKTSISSKGAEWG